MNKADFKNICNDILYSLLTLGLIFILIIISPIALIYNIAENLFYCFKKGE